MAIISRIRSTGHALPAHCISNTELEARIDTSDAWIRERTGITQRYVAAEGEYTSHLAAKAGRHALRGVSIPADETLGIIVATCTPDSTMPSVACLVQAALELPAGPALDVAAACSGFVYALSVAHGWLQGGICQHVLVIGAETMSRIVDWQDRNTCVLFGDGAGALLLSAEAHADDDARGLCAFALSAQGAHAALLGTEGGVSSSQTAGLLFMQGQEVFRHGVEKMSNIALIAAERAGWHIADIDWVVPHQANARMIRSIAKKLGIDEDRVLITVDQHANTSAATIPLALSVAHSEGRLLPGQKILMPALGAGLTWAAAAAIWG